MGGSSNPVKSVVDTAVGWSTGGISLLLPKQKQPGVPEQPASAPPPTMQDASQLSDISQSRKRRLDSMRLGFASTLGNYKPPVLGTNLPPAQDVVAPKKPTMQDLVNAGYRIGPGKRKSNPTLDSLLSQLQGPSAPMRAM